MAFLLLEEGRKTEAEEEPALVMLLAIVMSD